VALVTDHFSGPCRAVEEAIAVAIRVHTVNVYTAGILCWLRLNHDGSVLWLNSCVYRHREKTLCKSAESDLEWGLSSVSFVTGNCSLCAYETAPVDSLPCRLTVWMWWLSWSQPVEITAEPQSCNVWPVKILCRGFLSEWVEEDSHLGNWLTRFMRKMAEVMVGWWCQIANWCKW